MTTDIKLLVGGLYDLLEPVDPADRKKAIAAALTMLGDNQHSGQTDMNSGVPEGEELPFHPKARLWMNKYGVTAEQLGHVFHVENDSAEVVAHEVPGPTTKQQTINAYVITGIAQLLAGGEAKFDDKKARAVCKAVGCFSESNHATYMKDKGNLLGGTKDSGWTLTGPGLKAGADLVKGLASA